MNTIQTSEDLLKELNEIKSGLETHLDAKIAPIKSKLDATIKGFDQYQVNNTGRHAPLNAPRSFDEKIREQIYANVDNFSKLGRKEIKSFGFELKDAGDMGITTNYSGTAGLNSGLIVVPPTNRLTHVRSLLRQTTMTGSYLPILKDNGGSGAVAPVAENALKPQLDFDLAEASAKAETIAGFVRFSKQFLEDVNQAMGWISNKLIESYMLAEDNQLLNGNAVSPQLSGINHVGNYTDSSSGSSNDVIRLVEAILQLRSLSRNPTGILINPGNYRNILLNQATGSGEFDLPSFVTVSGVGQVSILGVPIVDSLAQDINAFDVIDNQGSILAFRDATRIEIFEQDGDNVIYNKITARIESRIAFPIYSSSYVVKGSFTPES